ncbi:hypothetical protein GmRootA79_51580 [Acidovorax sp. A79]|uniref:hypothetical protein n=1 Tax=Acidovorax sp. A79 TaxID=3056107 RepID=UPI0034E8EDE4
MEHRHHPYFHRKAWKRMHPIRACRISMGGMVTQGLAAQRHGMVLQGRSADCAAEAAGA